MAKEIVYKAKTQLALNTLFSIGVAQNILQEKMHAYIKTTGLTDAQFAIIDILGHNGPLKISEIYKRMLIKSGNKTMILDSLEEKDLIKRIFSKNDRREIIIELTQVGEKFFADNYKGFSTYVEKTLSVISLTEQKELNTLLNKLSEKI